MSKYLGKVKAVLGSHELLLDAEVIKTYINDSTNFEYLGCNLRFPAGSALKSIENKIYKSFVQYIGKTKLGIIGFTSETVTQTSVSLKDIEILDAIPYISTEAMHLERMGVTIILVLGFASYTEAKNIISQLPLVDIVIVGGIGGGEYTVENIADQKMYPVEILLRSGRRSIILHNFNAGYSTYIGLLTAVFNVEGFLVKYDGKMLNLNSTHYAQDEQCANELKELGNEDGSIKEMQEDKIGDIIPVLDMLRYDCSRMECNLGNFVADAMLEYISQEFYNGNNAENINVAIVPAYALTSSINVTIANMADIRHATSSVGDRTISVFNIKGENLLAALEEVAYKVPGVQFLQVAGLHIHYDLGYQKGYRVVEAYVLIHEGTLTTFHPVGEVSEIRIITLTSLLTNGLIPTLSAKYTNSSLINNKDDKPANLEEVLKTYISELKSFKRPCIEDRIIVNAAMDISIFINVIIYLLLVNIIYIELHF